MDKVRNPSNSVYTHDANSCPSMCSKSSTWICRELLYGHPPSTQKVRALNTAIISSTQNSTCHSTHWCSWWRHYATNRKVVISIPDEVTGIFNLGDHSGCTMALGSTQPLTEISTRNLPGRKRRPARKADNFTADCLENVGASTCHNPVGLHDLLQGLFNFFFTLVLYSNNYV
jgi:hypothetical protein